MESDVRLDYRVPAADLQPFVTLFYHFSADIPLLDDMERADHAQLRFRLRGENARYDFHDGSAQSAVGVHVIGPTTGAFRTRCDGPVLVIGMGLQPAGWSALIGIDASSMVNRVLDGEIVLGASGAVAVAAMRETDDIDARVAIAERFVRAAIAGADTQIVSFARTVDAWLASCSSPDVADLSASTGLSRRQMERRCNALYGVPPKMLSRKYRALRAAAAIASGAALLDDLIDEGFYDQSHLIRELKQFTGLTPRQLRLHPGQLATLTINNRRALGGQVHAIISDT